MDNGVHVSQDSLMKELESVEAFLANFAKVFSEVRFRDSKGGCFSVKTFYPCLVPKREVVFPVKVVWNLWVPVKVGFFALEAVRGRILTLDQLKRRG